VLEDDREALAVQLSSNLNFPQPTFFTLFLHILSEHVSKYNSAFSAVLAEKLCGGRILYGECQSGPFSHTKST
jgi:ABC-type oligopeptide transport system substrate-binding subunit